MTKFLRCEISQTLTIKGPYISAQCLLDQSRFKLACNFIFFHLSFLLLFSVWWVNLSQLRVFINLLLHTLKDLWVYDTSGYCCWWCCCHRCRCCCGVNGSQIIHSDLSFQLRRRLMVVYIYSLVATRLLLTQSSTAIKVANYVTTVLRCHWAFNWRKSTFSTHDLSQKSAAVTALLECYILSSIRFIDTKLLCRYGFRPLLATNSKLLVPSQRTAHHLRNCYTQA